MRIDIGGGLRLYVDIDGAGLVPEGPAMVERPTVVLLHGGPGMDHSMFKARSGLDLTDLAQVVYYDHRGNGRSDRGSSEDWTLDTWADDVVRLCDALGIERPVVVGASFGGFVAQRYLARHPEHPSRVALLCTAPRLDADVVAAAFGRVGDEQAVDAARRFWGGDSRAGLDYVAHCLPLYSAEPGGGDPDQGARTITKLDVMFHFQATDQPTMDERPGLAKATCPVLVAGGDLDPVCPIEMSDEIVAALANAPVTYERIEGASHLDVAPRAAAALRAFVAGASEEWVGAEEG